MPLAAATRSRRLQLPPLVAAAACSCRSLAARRLPRAARRCSPLLTARSSPPFVARRCSRPPPPLLAMARRRSPPPLAAAAHRRRSPPPLARRSPFAAIRRSPLAVIRRRSPPPLAAVALRSRVLACPEVAFEPLAVGAYQPPARMYTYTTHEEHWGDGRIPLYLCMMYRGALGV